MRPAYAKRCNIEGCHTLGAVSIPLHLKRGKRINHYMRIGSPTVLTVYLCAEHLATNLVDQPKAAE